MMVVIYSSGQKAIAQKVQGQSVPQGKKKACKRGKEETKARIPLTALWGKISVTFDLCTSLLPLPSGTIQLLTLSLSLSLSFKKHYLSIEEEERRKATTPV